MNMRSAPTKVWWLRLIIALPDMVGRIEVLDFLLFRSSCKSKSETLGLYSVQQQIQMSCSWLDLDGHPCLLYEGARLHRQP